MWRCNCFFAGPYRARLDSAIRNKTQQPSIYLLHFIFEDVAAMTWNVICFAARLWLLSRYYNITGSRMRVCDVRHAEKLALLHIMACDRNIGKCNHLPLWNNDKDDDCYYGNLCLSQGSKMKRWRCSQEQERSTIQEKFYAIVF